MTRRLLPPIDTINHEKRNCPSDSTKKPSRGNDVNDCFAGHGRADQIALHVAVTSSQWHTSVKRSRDLTLSFSSGGKSYLANFQSHVTEAPDCSLHLPSFFLSVSSRLASTVTELREAAAVSVETSRREEGSLRRRLESTQAEARRLAETLNAVEAARDEALEARRGAGDDAEGLRRLLAREIDEKRAFQRDATAALSAKVIEISGSA